MSTRVQRRRLYSKQRSGGKEVEKACKDSVDLRETLTFSGSLRPLFGAVPSLSPFGYPPPCRRVFTFHHSPSLCPHHFGCDFSTPLVCVLIVAGSYLFLVTLKAHQAFPPAPVDAGAPYASITPGTSGDIDTSSTSSLLLAGHRRAMSGGSVGGPVKKVGAAGGSLCGQRSLALTETLAHLVFLSAMAVSVDAFFCSSRASPRNFRM